MAQEFDSIAVYYDVLAADSARLKRETPFLEECLKSAPGLDVVDIACGTGVHALFLAEHGADVIARDLSSEMIEYSKARRPHPCIRYEIGDMRKLNCEPRDLVLCLGNSLCLLPSQEAVAETFASVSASLRPGGLFAIQIINYASTANAAPRHLINRVRCEGAEIIAVKNLVPCEDRTLLSLAFFILEQGRSVADSAILMNLSLAELDAFAERVGLRRVSLYGGFNQSQYGLSISTDLICLYKKQVPNPLGSFPGSAVETVRV
jgi:SAM-dependent methyltransferase